MADKSSIEVFPQLKKASIPKDSTKYEIFEKNYWDYYRRLEEEFISTFKYVDF